MKFTEAKQGRIFVLRLEHGDRLPDVIETFAGDHKVNSAVVLFIGGIDRNSKVVVGPEDGTAQKPVPSIINLPGVSEAVGVGTIFLDEDSMPKLHLHSAFGRQGNTITGCTREGVLIWHIGEVIIIELISNSAKRKIDSKTGFELLEVY
ncbi:PPC domain-containing DNA-binding protein [Phosphitispora sp. TUW77]|uniref:PPC domain-containing DNA-binding protein n=1 Tax=Phosphitispora sp. TUW77 TaxID=3152361 RepID=UPI003AB33D21